MQKSSDFWPDSRQLNLLKACVWENNDAIQNYQQWKQALILPNGESGEQLLAQVFDQLDNGSKRLLPLLYYNLTRLGYRDSIIDSIIGYHRYVWSKNQLIFHYVKRIVSRLNAIGVKHLFVKGVPLSKYFYQKDGVRPMNDIDLIIKESDLKQVLQLLSKDGWLNESKGSAVNFDNLIEFSSSLVTAKGDELDVHWRIFKDSFSEESEEELWEDPFEFKIDGFSAYTINPTYQLIHTLIHGMKWNTIPSFRWVCDSIIILRSESVNWDLFIQFCEKRKYSLRVYHSLKYLKDHLNVDIPNHVLDKISQIKTSKTEIRFFNQLLKERKPGSWSKMLMVHYQFQLYHANNSLLSEIKVLLKHYQVNWGIRYLASVPFYMAGRLLGLIQTNTGAED